MDARSGIVLEFVEEGNVKADQIERHLIDLEKNPASRESLAEIFRAMHTIKGATSFLGFSKLGGLAHTGESLLVPLRDAAFAANPEIVSALLSLVDAFREILTEIAATGRETDKDYSALVNTLTRLKKPA